MRTPGIVRRVSFLIWDICAEMFWGLVGGVDVGVWFYFLLYLAMMVSASWRWLSLVLVDGFGYSGFFMG